VESLSGTEWVVPFVPPPPRSVQSGVTARERSAGTPSRAIAAWVGPSLSPPLPCMHSGGQSHASDTGGSHTQAPACWTCLHRRCGQFERPAPHCYRSDAPPPHRFTYTPPHAVRLAQRFMPFDGRTSRSIPHTFSMGSPTPSAVNPRYPTPCSALSAAGPPRRSAPLSPIAAASRLPAPSQARLAVALPVLPPHA